MVACRRGFGGRVRAGRRFVRRARWLRGLGSCGAGGLRSCGGGVYSRGGRGWATLRAGAGGRSALRGSCSRTLSGAVSRGVDLLRARGLTFQCRIFAALPRRLGVGGRAPPAVSEEGSRGASPRAGPGQGPGRCRAKGSQPKAVQAVFGGFGVIRASRLYLSWSRKRLMCVMISFQSRSTWRFSSLRLASRSCFVMGVSQIFAHRVGPGSGRRYW